MSIITNDLDIEERIDILLDMLGELIIKIISPILLFIVTYFVGWLIKLTIGNQLIDGLNLIFNTARFTQSMIPAMYATFSTVGFVFKSYYLNKPSESMKLDLSDIVLEDDDLDESSEDDD